VGDVLRMAGGFNPVADQTRLSVERLDDRNGARIVQLAMPLATRGEVANGDVLRAYSMVDVALSSQRQNKRVRVEGEVQRPGDYLLPANSTLQDAIAAAGGLSPSAYVFGTEFSRESVQVTQQANYDKALRDLETELTRATSTQRTSNADDAAAQTARAASTTRLVEQMRAVRPTGRVVLQIPPNSRELPALVVEDGDRLYFPSRSTTVGVFGSVFNGGSYLHTDGRAIDEYLRLAGGPTRGADSGSTFVIRANGSVVSARQSESWLGNGALSGLKAEPGDTVFVPEEANKTTLVQNLKDWTQILSQFGLGLAAIKTLGN
jgi:protein involved in polysaccharide export with SLBB domain